MDLHTAVHKTTDVKVLVELATIKHISYTNIKVSESLEQEYRITSFKENKQLECMTTNYSLAVSALNTTQGWISFSKLQILLEANLRAFLLSPKYNIISTANYGY